MILLFVNWFGVIGGKDVKVIKFCYFLCYMGNFVNKDKIYIDFFFVLVIIFGIGELERYLI